MISILLVDDHAIVREGYRSLLSKQANLHVIAEASNGAQAYQQLCKFNPDVVVMDISLPGVSGLDIIARIKQRNSQTRILVFSMHQNPAFALQAIRAGAVAYITKSNPPEILIEAIYHAHAKNLILSDDITKALALAKLDQAKQSLESLTTREFEILRLILQANTTEQIAQLLHISPKTVGNCHYLIKRKLGVSNDIELMYFGLKLNVVEWVSSGSDGNL